MIRLGRGRSDWIGWSGASSTTGPYLGVQDCRLMKHEIVKPASVRSRWYVNIVIEIERENALNVGEHALKDALRMLPKGAMNGAGLRWRAPRPAHAAPVLIRLLGCRRWWLMLSGR